MDQTPSLANPPLRLTPPETHLIVPITGALVCHDYLEDGSEEIYFNIFIMKCCIPLIGGGWA